jgi:Lon protease-like protein
MDRTPTSEDAKLILHLYELRREPRMREARDWFARDFRARTLAEFQALCPQGSPANASYRMVATYWEMAASFVTHGALHAELFYESNQEMLFLWERIRELLPQLRETFKNPMSLNNVERVAGSFIEWWDARAPGAHAAFVARINQIPPTPQKG